MAFSRQRAIWTLALAGLSAGGVFLGLLAWTGRTVSIHSLAVQNLSHDPGDDALAADITSQLAANLSRIQGVSIQTAAADAVLEGNVRRAGGQVRITVRLVQSRGRKLLWIARYQRDLPGLAALEREIAQKIAGLIHQPLSSPVGARPAPPSKP
jgi:TolB-like protein